MDCILYHISVHVFVIMSYLGIQRGHVIKDTLKGLKAKHSSVLENASLQFLTTNLTQDMQYLGN